METYKEPLQRRSWIVTLLLGIVTLGIYRIYTMYKIGEACNDICEDDGDHTMNFVGAFFLGIITIGIYWIVWEYKVIERLKAHGNRYGIIVPHDGSSYLLWSIFGSFLFGFGPIFASTFIFANYNAYVPVYGSVTPVPYGRPAYGPQVYNGPVPVQNQVQQPQIQQPQVQQPQVQQPQPQPGIQAVPPTRGADNQLTVGSVDCIAGEYNGIPFEIRNNEEIVIGRDPNSTNIIIMDPEISNIHVKIKFNGVNKQYRVTDCSTNGTYVNGQRLQKDNPYMLSPGTVIMLSTSGKNAFMLR